MATEAAWLNGKKIEEVRKEQKKLLTGIGLLMEGVSVKLLRNGNEVTQCLRVRPAILTSFPERYESRAGSLSIAKSATAKKSFSSGLLRASSDCKLISEILEVEVSRSLRFFDSYLETDRMLFVRRYRLRPDPYPDRQPSTSGGILISRAVIQRLSSSVPQNGPLKYQNAPAGSRSYSSGC